MRLLSRRRRSPRPRVLSRRPDAQAQQLRAVTWELDMKTRAFTYVSPWVVELFGYPLEEWHKPDFWLEHLHPEDRPWASEFCFESTADFRHHELEYRFLAADGRTRWVRDVIQVVDRPEGTVLVGIMIDVTDFRREETLARTRTLQRLRRRKVLVRLSTLQHKSRRAAWRRLLEEDAKAMEVERVDLWTLAPDGSFIECRDLYLVPGGLHERGFRLRAQDCPAYFKALEQARVIAIRDVEADPRIAELREKYLRPAGIVSKLIVPIRFRGRLRGFICHEQVGRTREWTPSDEEFAGAIADLAALAWESAERKAALERLRRLNAQLEQRVELRTAELEAANDELEAFSYSLAHDLRAPLRHINGYAKMMMRELGGRLDPGHARQLGRIAADAVHMDLLIEGLQALSHAAKCGLHRALVEPEPIVRAVLDSLRSETSSRWVQVNVGPLPACRADPKLLLQVYANLLSNALKFTRGRDPAVVEVGALPGGVYFVKDNGTGFEMRHAARLFRIFERVYTAHHMEGTGAGLAIVKRIVDRHGGRIWAESEPGKGATFYFTIEPGL